MSARWLTSLPLVLGFFFWFSKGKVEQRLAGFTRPAPVVTLETAQFYSKSAKKFSLGFDNFLADLAWLRLLQGASHEILKEGGVSWEYANVNLINTLDPKFTKAYWFGASFVSIFRRDKIGAKDILQKWTVVQPLYWKSHYMLGFHLFHEMQEYDAGGVEILKAANLAMAPGWLTSLGIRLLTESEGAFPALQTALQLYESLQDDEGRYRLAMRIRSLNFTLQKAAWRDGMASYRQGLRRELASPEEAIAKTLSRLTASPDAVALLAERFTFRYDPLAQDMVGVLSPSDGFLETTGIHSKTEKTQ